MFAARALRAAVPATRALRTVAVARGGAAPASSNEVGKAIEEFAKTQTGAGEVCPFKTAKYLKEKGYEVATRDVLAYLKAKDPEFVWWRFADENRWNYSPLPGSTLPFANGAENAGRVGLYVTLAVGLSASIPVIAAAWAQLK